MSNENLNQGAFAKANDLKSRIFLASCQLNKKLTN